VLTKNKRNLFTTQWAWFGNKDLTTKPTMIYPSFRFWLFRRAWEFINQDALY